MKTLTLKRISSFADGTFGVLLDNHNPFAITLEPKWGMGNGEDICIMNGLYTCKRIISPKFGETFEVTKVKNRTHILFHKGNIDNDTKGCILIGEQFETLNNKTAILSSKKGFDEFMSKLKGIDEFKLDIIWCI